MIVEREEDSGEVSSIKFSSLQELEEWYNRKKQNQHSSVDSLRIPRESLSNYARSRESVGDFDIELLVCHDYKGNYQEFEDDSPIGYFPHPSGIHYFLQYPSLVNYFVYFSHSRIAIPPVSWINSLHRQGIPCLGTIIFEGTSFAELDSLLDKNEDGNFKNVETLVELTKHYGFDGWLINIETRFSNGDKGKDFLNFIELLKGELHLMNPFSKLVWYDSFISSKNRTFYQNCVNSWNFDFYSNSDLFFSNYWWDESDLKTNIMTAGLHGTRTKIFSGIDIFGRGSKVGHGGFTTGTAISALRQYSSNIALFAPAWTYESFPKDRFLDNDRKFWIGDKSTDSTGGAVATYVPHFTHPLETRGQAVSFYTNFSQGDGEKFYVQGVEEFNGNWVNGNLQLYVPKNIDHKQLEISKKDAYNGGSSLKVIQKSSAFDDNGIADYLQLFNFKHDITSSNLKVKISFKFPKSQKKLPDGVSYQIEVKYYIERRYRTISRSREGSFKQILEFTGNDWTVKEMTFAIPNLQIREHFVLEGLGIRLVHRTALDNDDNELMNENDYIDEMSEWVNVSSNPEIDERFEILLGDISLLASNASLNKPRGISQISQRRKLQDNKLYLEWNNEEDVLYWIVYTDSKFSGIAHTNGWIVDSSNGSFSVDSLTRRGELIKGGVISIE